MSTPATRPWTSADIPDLAGKTAVITGANSGIGFEATKQLARHGAHAVLACRSPEKARDALARLGAAVPGASAEVMQLDLASLASVRRFAEELTGRHPRLDLLVNNAGIMAVPYGQTEDGFELQFGTNHLGHFALTGLVLDALLRTPGSRVVTVSSLAHRMGSMDFEDLMFVRGRYSPMRAYGRSKLASLLFTYELQRRFEAARADAMALAAHPGSAATNLSRSMDVHWYARLARPLMDGLSQRPGMGALPTVRAAVDPAATGGQFYGPGRFMEQRGYPVVVASSSASHRVSDARHLWRVSEELTGVRFGELDERFPGA